MCQMRKKAPITGEEFSYKGGKELILIYNSLDHRGLLITVCKEMTLNEFEMIYFKLYMKQIGWFPGFLTKDSDFMKDFSGSR